MDRTKHQNDDIKNFELLESSKESYLRRSLNFYTQPFSSTKNLLKTLRGFFPFFEWLPQYSVRDQFVGDLVGGLMGGIMNITKGSAYAQLAGIAPVNGLYALCLGSFVYPIFASWSQGSMCAFAIIQLMCGSAVEQIMSAGNETELALEGIEPSTIVSTLTFMNGIMFLIFALLRLQFLTTHFSKPLISGFLTAAILHLIMTQVGSVIGVKKPRHKDVAFGEFFYDLYSLFLLLPQTNGTTFGISCACFAFLLSTKSLLDTRVRKWAKSKRCIVPWELLLVILVTLAVYIFKLDSEFDVKTVGAVPSGLPHFQPPNLLLVPQLIRHSVAISIVQIAFHISLARVMCQRKKYKIDEQQEIYALGGVHVFTGFFPSFPTTNGLGRAMVIDACGATTQVCSIVTALLLLLVLLSAGQLFYWIPLCVLAVIVLVSTKELLMGFKELPYYWSKSKWDGFIWLSTFLASLGLDVILGLAVGIAVQMFSVVTRTQWPKWEARVREEVAVLKFHSMLTFSNTDAFNEAVEELCRKWTSSMESPKHLILDCSAITALDTCGMEALLKVKKDLKANYNCSLLFSELEEEHQDKLAKMDPKLDVNLFFLSTESAFASLHLDLREKSGEKKGISGDFLSSV